MRSGSLQTRIDDLPAPGRLDAVEQRAAELAQRTEAMLRMMELGMPLHEIEQQLDWLDAQARLKRS